MEKPLRNCDAVSFLYQQTTVEEQSRIVQLEEQLSLTRAEVKDLRAQLRRVDAEAPGTNTQPASGEPHEENGQLNETYKSALAESRQEVESLRALVDKQNLELSEVKQKVQQATKENVEMMDTWKVTTELQAEQSGQVVYKEHVISFTLRCPFKHKT